MSRTMTVTLTPLPPVERRRHPRRAVAAANSIAWIRKGHRLYPAQVVDESTHGIGLILKQSPPFHPGQIVSFEWLRKQLETFVGTIRVMEAVDADRWRLGVEWSE